MRKRDRATNRCFKSTKERSHLWYFEFTVAWEKNANMLYSRLSQLISDKRNLSKSITMNWFRTKVCFALLKSSLLCLRGSRMVCRKISELECDIDDHSDMPKFELYNSNILACPGETSLSHLNYYICNFSNPFIPNPYRKQAIDFTLRISSLVSI